MNALTQAIKVVGSQAELARRLGITSQVVHNWRIRGNVPAEYAPMIELVTCGAVSADDVRPDVPWHVIRGRRRKAPL